MKRLLVTGGSGYLGMRLARAAQAWETSLTYFSHAVDLPGVRAAPVDLSDPAQARAALDDLRPDAIVHTACSNASPAQVNAIRPAARCLAQYAAETGCRLVHISTDLVFDGEHAPYPDQAQPEPITEYGRAKAEAEAEVARLAPAAAIVRPSLIWGLDPIDRQTRWLADGARDGARVTLFTDELRCPVYVHDLAPALLELAARPELSGQFNLGGPQALNRWDFGQRLLAALGLRGGANVVPGRVKDSGLVRARDLTLISARAAAELLTPLRGVDEVLEDLRAGRGHRPRYCEG